MSIRSIPVSRAASWSTPSTGASSQTRRGCAIPGTSRAWERGVPYVRERFFKGGEFTGLSDMRSAARRWCLEVAGQRIHGTTRRQPLTVFRQEERHTLGEWDAEPYEMTDWRTAKVHPDHHIACQYALYSVPSATCPAGQKVEVRLGSKLVRIYHRGRLIKVHPRQDRGGRSTDPDDYPAELSAYTLRAPEQIKRSAASQGPAVAAYAERLFDGPLPWAKLRQGHKLIRLGERYSPERLDAACRRALSVDLIDVRRLERILSRPWSRRPRSRSLHRCPQVDSPGRAPSSLVPTAAPLNQHKENAHDHHD